MRPLNKDLTRCMGDSCKDKNHCKRYMTQVIDDPDGLYSFMRNIHKDSGRQEIMPGECSSFISVAI